MTVTPAHSQAIHVLVLGSTGRVGRAVLSSFERSDLEVSVHTLGRYSAVNHEAFDLDLDAVLGAVDVVLNLAGVAHLDRTPSATDLDRLTAANLILPLLLARRCLDHQVPLIHVSSSKADDARTPYGWSKALCDATLDTSFGQAFAAADLPLVVLKPPALLIGPFDTGKLRHLQWLDRIPKQLFPQRTLPVLSSARFVDEIGRWITECVMPSGDGALGGGLHMVRWSGTERDGLHAIQGAMREARKNRRR